MTNPAAIAPGQPVEYTWGLAVRSTVVMQYASVAAFMADFPAPHEGQTITVGGELMVWRNGALHGVAPMYHGGPQIRGANISAGETPLLMPAVGDVVAMGPNPVPRLYQLTWYYQLSGHTVGSGEFQPSWKTTGGVYFGIGPSQAYMAGQTTTGTSLATVYLAAGATLGLQPWARIFTLSGYPNTNIDGYVAINSLPY